MKVIDHPEYEEIKRKIQSGELVVGSPIPPAKVWNDDMETAFKRAMDRVKSLRSGNE